MAEKTEFLQAIDDAILDADSLERFINGDDTQDVLTRLSAEYPTIRKALKELFENGGIAGRYKTLVELQTKGASLEDGSYALVADDTNDKNGIYIKEGGAWVKSKYDALNRFRESLKSELSLTPVKNTIADLDATNNLDDEAVKHNGYYINASSKLLATSSTEMRRLSVNPNEILVFNTNAEISSISFHFSKDNSLNVGSTDFIKAEIRSANELKYIIVPNDAYYLSYNSIVNTVNLNNTPIVINKSEANISKISGYTLVDEYARTIAIKDTDLTYTGDTTQLNRNMTDVVYGYYISTGTSNTGHFVSSPGTDYGTKRVNVEPNTSYIMNINSVIDYAVFAINQTTSDKIDNTLIQPIDYQIIDSNTISFSTNDTAKFINFTAKFVDRINLVDADSVTLLRADNPNKAEIQKIKNLPIQDVESRKEIELLKSTIGRPLSTLEGKVWVAIGDSITQKNHRSSLNYHDYIKDVVGSLSVVNKGIGGTGYYDRYNAANDISGTPDLITVMFGTNDTVTRGKLIGSFLDAGTETISGCINTLMTSLINSFPNSRVAFITSIPSKSNWGNRLEAVEDGFKLVDVVDLVIRYCEHYSIPCLDLYRSSGLHPWLPEHDAIYFSSAASPSGDGVHPNEKGHKIMAAKIKPFLESLFIQ